MYKAQWQGQEVIYKNDSKIFKEDDKVHFKREFSVWQYVIHYLYLFLFFSAKITLLRKLNHPSCVSLHGIVEEGQKLSIVEEYCPNRSLYYYYDLNFFFLNL